MRFKIHRFPGGSRTEQLHLMHPDQGSIGSLQYVRHPDHLQIELMQVKREHRGNGYASQLMDELQRRNPGTPLDHGERTDAGQDWWDSYSSGKNVQDGRTMASRKTAITIPYLRNPQSSQQYGDFGERYGQHVEPRGRYLIERSGDHVPEGWEAGEVTFHNPKHMDFGGGYTSPDNWKHRLSAEFDGKRGEALSRALLKAGHDGIITHDEDGTREIVDLTPLRHQARTDRWPPYLTERPDEYGDPIPVNESRHNARGPVGTEEEAKARGWVGPYFHGTTKRRAQDIRRGGFRQPRMHNWEMSGYGTIEEIDKGATHRTFFADNHQDAHDFARAIHGDDVDVVKAYLHPDHLTTEEGGGFMDSTQVKDVAHAMAIREPRRARTASKPQSPHLTYRHQYHPGMGLGRVQVHDPDFPEEGGRIGELQYAREHEDHESPDSHYVSFLWVHPDYRRQGIARDMYDLAQRHNDVHHSEAQTEAGAAWAKRVGRAVLPRERLFGPTYGLDQDIFSGDQLKPAIRDDLIGQFDEFCRRHRYTHWRSWAKIIFFGSEASRWSGPELVGNGDFDISIGIEYDRLRATNPVFRDADDADIAALFTQQMHAELNDPEYVLPEGRR